MEAKVSGGFRRPLGPIVILRASGPGPIAAPCWPRYYNPPHPQSMAVQGTTFLTEVSRCSAWFAPVVRPMPLASLARCLLPLRISAIRGQAAGK